MTVRVPGGRRDVLLGKYGTPESRERYARVVAELKLGHAPAAAAGPDPSVNEVLLRWWVFADRHYRRQDGTPTNEVVEYKHALRFVRELYGLAPAREFGPLALKAVREKMIGAGWCRNVVNRRVGRVRRVFRWAAGEELVPATVPPALAAVAGLQRGRTAARETERVRAVPEADLRIVLSRVPPAVAGMLRVQLHTGMRPGEVTQMRPCDLDTSGTVWTYRPEHHKTAHHGKDRTVFIGPACQEVLRGFWPADPSDYFFSPARQAADRTRGKRPRKEHPERTPGRRYKASSYWRAVTRACEVAGVKPFHPHMVRHLHAVLIRERFGQLESVRAALGQSSAAMADWYSRDGDARLASAVAAEIG